MMNLPTEIEKQKISTLPLVAFDGKIIVVEDIKDVSEAVEYLKQFPVLGFDTETKPSFKKGVSNKHKVSLLQLYANNRAYLFRLNKIGLPDKIKELLSDKDIIKTGAATSDDVKGLKKLSTFTDAGFVDIQKIATKLSVKPKSLRRLTAMFFRQRLSKSQQLSNWEADQLTESQCLYAATDAWIGYKLYCEMNTFLNNEGFRF